MLIDEELRQLQEGQSDHVVLGCLPGDIARLIGPKIIPEVILSQQSYRHIKFEHPELEPLVSVRGLYESDESVIRRPLLKS